MEIFLIFQHKVEGTPHFARVSEVRHMYLTNILYQVFEETTLVEFYEIFYSTDTKVENTSTKVSDHSSQLTCFIKHQTRWL